MENPLRESITAGTPAGLPLWFLWMAFDALKHRYIAEIHRVFEWLVGFMTGLAFSIAEGAKIHRVLESRDLYRSCGIL